MEKRRVYLKTFGCQMNEHDSERILGILSGLGYAATQNLEEADLALLNTCSIREKANHKAYSDLGRIEKIKRKNPSMILGVAGCMAKQEGTNIFNRVPQVNLIFNSKNIWKLPLLLEAAHKGQGKIMALEDVSSPQPYSSHRKGKVKAWVSIMEGCDKQCSYCIVPYTRGREISRPFPEIIHEVQALGEAGYKEITLLGQNVNSYGRSLGNGMDFADLLSMIHEAPGIDRIRFITSHPWDLSQKLIDTMAGLPKICEHLHLPLQSGSNRVLRGMKREYTYEEYRDKITRLRKSIPNISLTTDIIAGFPGEDESDFQETLNALEEIEYDGIFSFKYSHRPNTAAIGMPDQIPEPIKDDRLHRLIQLQRGITDKRHRVYLHGVEEVLVERVNGKSGKQIGRTRTNLTVHFEGDPGLMGTLVNIKITKIKTNSFEGDLYFKP